MRTILWWGLMAAGVGAQCGWDPGRFSHDGVAGTVNALLTWDDGSGPAVYAAGNFNAAGKASVSGVAKWDGTAWREVGGGLAVAGGTAEVAALAIFDDGSGEALYVGGWFTAAGGLPISYLVRWDGTVWSALGSGFDRNVTALVVHDDGTGPALVVAGYRPAGSEGRIARWDGATWTTLALMDRAPRALESWTGALGPELYVGGLWTTLNGATLPRMARLSGGQWSAVGTVLPGFEPDVLSLRVWDDGSGEALYAGGNFQPPSGLAGAHVARWDGQSWSPLATGLDGPCQALLPFHHPSGPVLVAGGSFGTAGSVNSASIAQWDGIAWASLGAGLQSQFGGTPATYENVRALATLTNGGQSLLVAGGAFDRSGTRFVRNIGAWDGGSWHSLGSDTGLHANTVPRVVDLEAWDDGSRPALFAAGFFTRAGGQDANHVARFDGVQWSTLDGGVTVSPSVVWPQAQAVKVFDDGTGDALYVGGNFTQAGSVPGCYGIARWDGTTWSPLSSGLAWPAHTGAGVRGLQVYDNGDGPLLYAGGQFHTAGSHAVRGLARWNGVAWSPVGLGFAHGLGIDAGVGDLAVFDDGSGPALYALGYYVLPIGIAVSRLERWDGSRWTWVPISPEVAGPMAVFSSGLGAPRLYFGARGTVDGLVSFDGSGWQTHPGVLAGVNGGEPAFSSLVAFNDGSGPVLCVGGRFDITGVPGGLGTNVACFDGTSWRSLGGGPSGAVEAMAVGRVGGDVGLFLGGAFESASGAPATGLAAWTGCPSLVGLTLSQQQIPPFGVFLQNTNLTPGREYFNIVSLEPCASGPGTGPYGGLCFTNPSFLIAQLTLPLPAPPFHFQALEETHTFGPFTGLGPLTLEVLSFDITGGVLGSVSGVRQLTVQ